MQAQPVLIEQHHNGIASITFNRPDRHNAFDEHIIQALITALKALESDHKVKIVLLKANGKNFSAGADLDWMRRMVSATEEDNITDALQLVELLKLLYRFPKPTIALVQGLAMGGGAGLLCCCDIVLADGNARFCFPEAKIGLVPATIAPYVIAAIGQRQARYYFLTTKEFCAEEALRIGLVNEVVTKALLFDAGLHIATDLAQNGPRALATIKQLSAHFLNAMDENLLLESAKLIAITRTSAEAQEGVNAFFEKRVPAWSIVETTG